MRNMLAGLMFVSLVAVSGGALANPTPGECYSPCAQQYSDASDRMRCIGRCCGCANSAVVE